MRVLVDTIPPYGLSYVSEQAKVSPSYASRTLDALEEEALVRRAGRGRVVEVDWPALVRRRAETSSLFDPLRTLSFIARRGIDDVLRALGAGAAGDREYAVTGSFAAARLVTVAAPRGLVLYYDGQAVDLTGPLGLMAADEGGDVRVITPPDRGVFERAEVDNTGVLWAAPSQVAIDCLAGTGRMPEEGEAVLDWMAEHETRWRRPNPAPTGLAAAAILITYNEIDRELRKLVASEGVPVSKRDVATGRLARLAIDRGLISEDTFRAFEALRMTRDRLGHQPDKTTDSTTAEDLELASTVLAAIRASEKAR